MCLLYNIHTHTYTHTTLMQNMPSATQVREELINDRREKLIDGMFTDFARADLDIAIAARKAIIDQCIEQVGKMTVRLWHCYREGSVPRAAFGGGWEMHEDPDTSNYFYCKRPQKPLMGEVYTYTHIHTHTYIHTYIHNIHNIHT
jgi:hypothetical protein